MSFNIGYITSRAEIFPRRAQVGTCRPGSLGSSARAADSEIDLLLRFLLLWISF